MNGIGSMVTSGECFQYRALHEMSESKEVDLMIAVNRYRAGFQNDFANRMR
tara:strand:- start:168362 stop:168514 length:153 start_codon:yes stop_codon:yes gene_type:complete